MSHFKLCKLSRLGASGNCECHTIRKAQNSITASKTNIVQAIRMLSGECTHNRPDSETPKTKGDCIICISEAAIEALMKNVGDV